MSLTGTRTGTVGTVGTDGNERLTALTAVVLLALLAVEGVTIVFMHQLLPVHLFVGLMVVVPVGLKLASTGYRFVRYYTGDAAYRRKGPPPIVLRALAPLLIVSTLTVLASGVWLLLAGPSSRDAVLPIHKISFIVWVALFGLHILGHMTALPREMSAEYLHRDHLPGRGSRQISLALAAVGGIAIAVLLIPDFGAWQVAQEFRHHFHH